jgi:hypothetical protein
MLEEVVVQVLVEPLFKMLGGRLPFHGIRKFHISIKADLDRL